MTLNRLFAATVLIALAPVAAARAQGVEGTRSGTIFVGTGLSLAGNAINEGVGTIDGKPVVGYRQEPNVSPTSTTLKVAFVACRKRRPAAPAT